jgi:hypothetical protein
MHRQSLGAAFHFVVLIGRLKNFLVGDDRLS